MNLLNQYFFKRETHINNNKEFNVEEQPCFNIEHIINWSKIVAKQNELQHQPFRVLELGTKRSIQSLPTNSKKNS